ncbi:hypothetical protein [Marinibactrum halimedae]|nr:hypothetical protein [Marinibactrum halimedae]MCD9458790.1 hypothetical protein [Marinibactrum halimedae]
MYKEIPGLHFFPEFLSASDCQAMLDGALCIHKRLKNAVSSLTQRVDIPQPQLVQNDKDGLNQQKTFSRYTLPDHPKSIQCEVFSNYGGEGHQLVYCRGNENLPCFIEIQLPKVIEQLQALNLVTENLSSPSWRFTMNFYHHHKGQVAGFPFHVDIPANGVVTMIMNIQREATFEITNGQCTEAIHLPVGALLLLSGESRYQWKHRVLPTRSTENKESKIERVSLVLGIK